MKCNRKLFVSVKWLTILALLSSVLTACGTKTQPAANPVPQTKTTSLIAKLAVDGDLLRLTIIASEVTKVSVRVYINQGSRAEPSWYQLLNADEFALPEGETIFDGRLFKNSGEMNIKAVINSNREVIEVLSSGNSMLPGRSDVIVPADSRSITCDMFVIATIDEESTDLRYGMGIFFDEEINPYLTFRDVANGYLKFTLPADHQDWQIISLERDGGNELPYLPVYCKH